MSSTTKAGEALVEGHNKALRKAGLAAETAQAVSGVTNIRFLTVLPEQVLREIGKLAQAVTDGGADASTLKKLLKQMEDPSVSVRNRASDELYDLIVKRLLPKGKDWSPGAIRAATKAYGPEVLLLFPVYADSYRRHLAGGGTAKSFEEFLDIVGNKQLQRNALPFLDDSLPLAMRIKSRGSAVLRAGARNIRSTHAQRLAVLAGFRKVIEEVGAEVFFELLFAKSKFLIPKGQRERIMQELLDYIYGRKELPERLARSLTKKGLLTNDLNGLQGMAGEALSMKHRIDDAKALAKDNKGPVYILSDMRLDSQRLGASAADEEILARMPKKVSDALDDAELKDLEEAAVVAQVNASLRKEYTDGATVHLDGEGGLDCLRVNEVKVSKTGLQDGVEQFGEAQENIETMSSLRVGSVIEVTPDGKHRVLSLEEAEKAFNAKRGGDKAYGAKVVEVKKNGKVVKDHDGNPLKVLEITEDPDLLDEIAALEKKLDEPGVGLQDVVAETQALRDKRKLKNFFSREKDLFVGENQKAAAHGINVRSLGHDYEAISDTMFKLLFLTGLQRS